MSQSEVAQIKQSIEDTYVACQRGFTGFAHGVGKHEFITKRTEKLGKLHDTLGKLIGEIEAMQVFAEAVDTLPNRPLRRIVTTVLQEELGETQETQHLISWIEDMWETMDILVNLFSVAGADKIIRAF
jgi:hypothetical protein